MRDLEQKELDQMVIREAHDRASEEEVAFLRANLPLWRATIGSIIASIDGQLSDSKENPREPGWRARTARLKAVLTRRVSQVNLALKEYNIAQAVTRDRMRVYKLLDAIKQHRDAVLAGYEATEEDCKLYVVLDAMLNEMEIDHGSLRG